jgi:beta propeller repeat protein
MLTNITTGSTVQLTNQNDSILPVSELRHNYNSWIDRDRVVWTEHETDSASRNKGKIVLLNLTTGERYYLPTGSPGNQSFPRISGDFVIWVDCRNDGKDNTDLYLFNLKTGTETRLTQPKMLRSIPYIQGDQVLWAERINGVYTIIHYAISTGTRTILGPGFLHEGHIPQLSGTRVVWLQVENPLDIREQRNAITLMDRVTSEKTRVTPFRDGLSSPMISGDRIIYIRGAGKDIFTEPREIVLVTLAPRPVPSASTITTGTDAGNTTPSPSLNQNAVPPTGTTLTASPGFSAILLIISLAAGATLGRSQ